MHAKRLLGLAVLLLSGSLSSGCATILHGPTKTIQVVSEPAGAEILRDGEYKGRTPETISYSGMEKDMHLLLRLPGYRDQSVEVPRDFDPIAILNCGSVICWGVDVLTGAMWRFDNAQIAVHLQPLNAGPYPPPPDGAPANSPTMPPPPPPEVPPPGAPTPKPN